MQRRVCWQQFPTQCPLSNSDAGTRTCSPPFLALLRGLGSAGGDLAGLRSDGLACCSNGLVYTSGAPPVAHEASPAAVKAWQHQANSSTFPHLVAGQVPMHQRCQGCVNCLPFPSGRQDATVGGQQAAVQNKGLRGGIKSSIKPPRTQIATASNLTCHDCRLILLE